MLFTLPLRDFLLMLIKFALLLLKIRFALLLWRINLLYYCCKLNSLYYCCKLNSLCYCCELDSLYYCCKLNLLYYCCESARRLASPTNSVILSSAIRRAIVALIASTNSVLPFFIAIAEPPSVSWKVYSAIIKSGFAFT